MSQFVGGPKRAAYPLRRPIGPPRCAYVLTSAILIISMMLWVTWSDNYYIYSSNSLPMAERLVIAPHLFVATPTIFGFYWALILVYNKGYPWIIRFVILLFDFLYWGMFASIIVTVLLLAFVDGVFVSTLLGQLLILLMFPYIRSRRKNCRWVDLTSLPDEWELPASRKYRDRLLAERGQERLPAD